jgi:hypothetical protein
MRIFAVAGWLTAQRRLLKLPRFLYFFFVLLQGEKAATAV